MGNQPSGEIIEVLDCDLAARPGSAPGPGELTAHVRGVAREPGALVVEFDERAAEALEAFVEAERLCCAGIDWQMEGGAGLRLRISGEDTQLAAIESLLNGNA